MDFELIEIDCSEHTSSSCYIDFLMIVIQEMMYVFQVKWMMTKYSQDVKYFNLNGRVKVRGGVRGTNKYHNRPRIFVMFVVSIDGINGRRILE